MRFTSEQERMKHTQVKLIPRSVWRSIFYESISESVLALMSMPEHELFTRAKDLYRGLSGQDQLKILLCCAYREPALSDASLRALCTSIQCPVAQQVHLAAITGRLGFLTEIFNSTSGPDFDQRAFVYAAQFGHLNVMNELMRLEPERVQDMIAGDSFEAFVGAAMHGHLNVMNELMSRAPTRAQDMIAANDFGVFRYAAGYDHVSLIHHLLTFPRVLAFAEMHQYEYGRYVEPFIEGKITNLRRRHAAGHPSVVITQQEATSCFYILRHLMRQTPSSAESLDKIDFLMTIPAVRSLLHRSIEDGIENELLREAMRLNNQVLVERLLAVPAVNELARRDNFYPEEARGALDLRALSDYAESSMMALSPVEERMLKRLEARYKPAIDQKGVTQAFNEVYQAIMARYRANPIQFKRENGEAVALPLTKSEFDALTQEKHFTPKEITQANQCYYQHETHTLYRYLTQGNPWMHPSASFVEVDTATGARSADFDRYKPLIVLLWTAAADTTMMGTDGYTPETRLDELIAQIGRGIGRAHNWDKPRRLACYADGTPKLDTKGKTYMEQFDDLEGDRPSCSSGVRRRLFQSLMGHPLYAQDIRSVIEAVFRDKIRDAIKDMIHETATDGLEAMLVEYAQITQGEIPADAYLALSHEFDIQPKDINAWSQELHQCYDAVFGPDEVEAALLAAKKTFFAQTSGLGQFLASVELLNLTSLCQESLKQRRDGFINQLQELKSTEAQVSWLNGQDVWTGVPRLHHAIHLGHLGEVGRCIGPDAFFKLLTEDGQLKEEILELLANYGHDVKQLEEWLSALPEEARAEFIHAISKTYQALQSATPSSEADASELPTPESEPTASAVTFESLPDDPAGEILRAFEQGVDEDEQSCGLGR